MKPNCNYRFVISINRHIGCTQDQKKTKIFHSLSLFCTVQHDILCEFLLLLSLLLSSQFLFVTPALKYIKTVITFTLNIFVCLQNNVLNVLLFFFFGFCQLFVGCIWQEMYTRNRNESHRNLMCVCVCRDWARLLAANLLKFNELWNAQMREHTHSIQTHTNKQVTHKHLLIHQYKMHTLYRISNYKILHMIFPMHTYIFIRVFSLAYQKRK